MDRIRVAIVGAGDIAREKHLPAVLALADDVELVATVDVDLERARSLADVPAYDEVDAMLRVASPDLVLVCTPPGTHRPVVAACLAAGAWVWCEKPPTLSLAEYDELAAMEVEGGPYVAYVFQHRFGSGAARLRDRLPELGPCGSASATRCGSATTTTTRCRGEVGSSPRAAARPWATPSTSST